ncbi:MAG: aminotransferase class V-fold PLP-dependent enzyme, partial [Synergistota bacterium]|nr:aminotransferase class V-fold PLP-dependent enzyme [Synergistota bacterium]
MSRHLFTPGPVPLPDRVRSASGAPMIGHRMADFSVLLSKVENRLRDLLDVEGPVIAMAGSGTLAMESLAATLLRPGDSVISCSCGAFGLRFREIAATRGLNVIPLDFPEGETVSPSRVAEAVALHPGASALLLTHNETSTGVANPVEVITRELPADAPLVLVDAVSAVGAMPCLPGKWNVDGLAFCSQKGLLSPPGLGFAWLSERAWDAASDRGPVDGYFCDLKRYRAFLEKEQPQTPFTPPVSLLRAVDASLGMIAERGHRKWFDDRRRFARCLAVGVETMGMDLLVKDERFRSPGVTAVSARDGKAVQVKQALGSLGVECAARGDVVRFGHFGDMGWPEL